MCVGNEPSNWGTNSQPARTADTVKACTPEIPVLRAQTTPNPGSTITSPQGCPELKYFQVYPVSVIKFQIRGAKRSNPNQRQLEQGKRGRTFTSFTGNGRLKQRRNAGIDPVRTSRYRRRISRFPAGKSSGSGPGLHYESNGTGLESWGGRMWWRRGFFCSGEQ
ncbi:unnamed protein product [Prunus armeniaca]